MTEASKPSLRHAAVLAALTLLGIAGNLYTVPLLFGVDFMFGGIAVLIAVAIYGPAIGTTVALIAGIATIKLWNHPYFLVICGAEALLVGIFLRRINNNLLLASSLFWVLPGAILVWAFYGNVMDTPPNGTLLLWLKQSVNGIFNALIANVALVAWRLWRRSDGRASITLQEASFNVLVAIVFIPALSILVLTSRAKMHGVEQELATKVGTMAENLELYFSSWRQIRLQTLQEVARVAAQSDMKRSPQLHRDIEIIHGANTGFQSMVIGDATGVVIASHPNIGPSGRVLTGLNFSETEAFATAKATGQLAVSGVFETDGMVQVPIIGFALPIERDGKFAGYVSGAATTETLLTALNRYASSGGLQITAADQYGRVITSTVPDVKTLQAVGSAFVGNERQVLGNVYQRMPSTKNTPAMVLWQKSLYGVRRNIAALDWELIVEAPLSTHASDVEASYIESFGLMLALCVGGMVISLLLTWWISRPIAQLADVTTGLTARIQSGEAVSWPKSRLRELTSLVDNFRFVTTALSARFQELQVEIAERTDAQERLTAATEAAEAANRAKSEFLANMSHEIRTPLGAVLGFAELVGDQDMPLEERRQSVAAIQRNGDQLVRLIDEILDFSKIEAGHLNVEQVWTPIDDLISGGIDVLRKRADDKGLELKVVATSPIPNAVITDPVRLRQVLINIVGNGVKFTDRGYVHVAVNFEQKSEREGRLVFHVADTGIGIPPDAEGRLFQPFAQVDSSSTRRYGGTGLGLVLSRRLARAFGGDVTLVGPNGVAGSIFEIVFDVGTDEDVSMHPTLADARATRKKSTQRVTARSIKGVSILLVEDAPDNRMLFGAALRSFGATVDLAENGLEGLLKAKAGSYDVVLMDIQIPEMDGIEATKNLRKSGYSGPIVALTAHALIEDRKRCLDAGCDEHVAKPVDWRRLTELVGTLTNRPTT